MYVFRLDGLNGVGYPVAAVLCGRSRVAHEAALLGQILPSNGVTTLVHLGAIPDRATGLAWQFLEWADTAAYRRDGGNRALLAGWLAELHAAGSTLGGKGMADRGAGFHRRAVAEARAVLAAWQSAEPDSDLAPRALRALDGVEGRWDAISCRLSEMPHTLLHGDLKTKNTGLRTAVQGLAVGVFDWEFSGWGPIAVDLGTSALGPADVDVYVDVVGRRWPAVTGRDVESAVRAGRLLRAVMSVRWAVESLAVAPRKAEGAVRAALPDIEGWDVHW